MWAAAVETTGIAGIEISFVTGCSLLAFGATCVAAGMAVAWTALLRASTVRWIGEKTGVAFAVAAATAELYVARAAILERRFNCLA